LWSLWHTVQARRPQMDWNKLTDDERLIAEQAIAMARAVKLAGDSAAHGKGLLCLEQAVLDHGKQLMQTVMQKTISAHSEAQKRGSAGCRAPVEKSSGIADCASVAS
jgi:hypothetical protein